MPGNRAAKPPRYDLLVIIREIAAKGKESRFKKVDRGRFAALPGLSVLLSLDRNANRSIRRNRLFAIDPLKWIT